MKIKKLLIIVFSIFFLMAVMVLGISCFGGESTKPESETTQESVSTPAKTSAIVKFDVNTEHTTNVINEREITIGKRVSEPKVYIFDDNPDNLQVYGWYTTKECLEYTKWDFKKAKVSTDMTLYAKWVELYDVNYYVNGELHSTVNVFNGDYLEETAELVAGFKYLGSFKDANHTQLFDFDEPISGNTDIYVSRSLGLYLSDYEEAGLLSSGNLTDFLSAACGSYNPDDGTKEGWVEEYIIKSTGESCTYVNFGLNPKWGDGYVELSLGLDITQSQTIRLTFKNLGPAKTINCYFTAMIDENTYSETGPAYNSNFNYPNYVGGPVGGPLDIPYNMSEDDEWITVDFNLYEVYKNGYSVWGTSSILGALRIEVGYKNVSEDDWSNEMLIKSIEGIPCEITVEDSEEITEKMVNSSEEELKSAADAIESNVNGVSFIKNYNETVKTTGNVEIFKTTEGMYFYAENEIAARNSLSARKSFSINVPSDVSVNLSELTTLYLTIQNFGYAEELIVYAYNDKGVPAKITIEISSRMVEPRTYSINMYGLYGMNGQLKSLEFGYTSVGVDNLILFKSASFGEFVPYDVVGINFNDKKALGITSTDDVNISFDNIMGATKFDVSKSNATVVSPEREYDATNDGYEYMTLKYNLPQGSRISAVKVALKVNGQFGSTYEYAIENGVWGDNEVKLPLVKSERGYVKAVKMTFVGTGEILVYELTYSVGESSLPFYKSYDLIYNSGHTDWKGSHNSYEYDSKAKTSTFIKGPNEPYLGFTLYIGYSYYETYLQPPHETANIKITGKTRVTLIYQNKSSVSDLAMHLSFEYNDHAPSDGNGLPIMTNYALPIDSNMEEYEWSAVSVVVDGEYLTRYLDLYLAKIGFEFHGTQLTIRAISIEVDPSL